MARVSINTNDLRQFSRAMRQAGNREIPRQLRRGLLESAQIVRAAAIEIADNERIARTIKAGARGSAAFVQVGDEDTVIGVLREVGNTASHKSLLLSRESGKFRHPVFARGDESREEWTWVEQDTHPALGPAALAKEAEALEKLLGAVNSAVRSVHLDME